jgi:predicted nucleic acid-binding protein
MILDTSFLIGLQREWLRNESNVATRFLRIHDSDEFSISVVSAVEFLEGYEILRDGERLLKPFEWIDATSNIARTASRIRRKIRLE